MLTFTCAPHKTDVVIYNFVADIMFIMMKYDIKTVPCNYYDKDLKDKLNALVTRTDTGFIFDQKDELGIEPYGYVSDFFDAYLRVITNFKKKYPDISINGIVFVNDFGSYECVLVQRVESAPNTETVSFFDQLQCVHCMKYVDADKAYEKIYDEEVFWTEDGDCLYPSAYHQNGDEYEAVFCLCSEECKSALGGE